MALSLDTAPVGRAPRAWDFVRLKLRLMRNGLRGQAWRIVALVLGVLFGSWWALAAAVGLGFSGTASAEAGFVVATFAGAAVTLGWTLIPLLFFGVDETLDPARFALLPVPRRILTRGMFAAALVGVPAMMTLLGTSGLAIAAGIRFGPIEAVVALVGVVAGLALGVVASRALTSAFAALLRSRKVRDLAAIVLALLASSIAPLQWVVMSAADYGSLDQALSVARILAWTPFAAPYVVPFDIGQGRWLAAAARVALTAATIALLARWWSRTIESAMLGTSSTPPARAVAGHAAGPVASLYSTVLRPLLSPTRFGAIVARESRYWWRDVRRRASLISILMASVVVPFALNFAYAGGELNGQGLGTTGFGFAVSIAGTMGGLLLANQFAFDGNAYAAHLLASVPGRLEVRARAVALTLVAGPIQIAVVVGMVAWSGRWEQLPTGLGMLATFFGGAVASAAILSVLAPYALPETTNPFAMNSGGASAKGLLAFVAILAAMAICAPMLVASAFLGSAYPWLILVIGIAYGGTVAWLGTLVAGAILDRRGPEVLMAVTPRR